MVLVFLKTESKVQLHKILFSPEVIFFFLFFKKPSQNPSYEKSTIIRVQALKVEEKINFNIMLPQYFLCRQTKQLFKLLELIYNISFFLCSYVIPKIIIIK